MRITHKFLKAILNPLRETVIEASKVIMEVYEKDSYDLDIKSDGSPVTEADNRANDIIIKSLHRITPEIPIISEETYKKEQENPEGPYWLVDPLDGTKEFINKSKDFTVNIALIENAAPVFGIVGVPATAEIWHGSNISSSNTNFFSSIFKKRDKKQHSALDSPIRLVMSKSHQTDTDKIFLEFLEKKCISFTVVERGSSLKLCALADNKADIYPRFGPTSEWDIAAGHAYLLNKGGEVLQMKSGKDLRYTKEETILNPAFVAFRNSSLKQTYMPLLSEFYKKLV